jgi:hypothetical protein
LADAALFPASGAAALNPFGPVAGLALGVDDGNDGNLVLTIEKNNEVGKFLEVNSTCSV